MMNEEQPIKQRVMKTLHSLSSLEDIEAHPFLLTRLRAQIKEHEANKGILRFHARDFRAAFLLLFLVFNMLSVAFMGYYYAELRKDSLTTFAREYVFNQDAYSDQYSVISIQ